MPEKTFNTRVKLKYDNLANWISNDPVLLAGELALVEIPNENPAATTAPTVLAKVGDGTHTFSNLGWVSGLAADVYDWAKAENINNVVLSGSETVGQRFEAIATAISNLTSAGPWDNQGAAANAESNAKSYADTIAASAESNAKAYADTAATNAAAAAVADVVANADTKFDTLKEIADWIQSDTTGAAKMAADISNLQSSVSTNSSNISNNTSAISNLDTRLDEVESAVSNIQAESTDIDALTQQNGYVIFDCGSSSLNI